MLEGILATVIQAHVTEGDIATTARLRQAAAEVHEYLLAVRLRALQGEQFLHDETLVLVELPLLIVHPDKLLNLCNNRVTCRGA